MQAKEYRKYGIIEKILKDGNSVELLKELATIDFTIAMNMWEYKFFDSEEIFKMFNDLSETKTRQLLIENSPLLKLIYISQLNETGLKFLVNLILSPKIEIADEILRYIKSNTNINYDDAMMTIVNSVFNTYCEREQVKKCSLNRKQTALLLDYVSKIKGPNKMLLTQRIKEL